MEEPYLLLGEKEEIWAKMLVQVLQDNRIPCVAVPVRGAGFVVKTGLSERLRILVPPETLPRAKELLEELFPGEA